MSRFLFALIALLVLLVAPVEFLKYWTDLFGLDPAWALIGGVALSGVVASNIAHRFVINNPEWSAYITQNDFSGSMVPYGPGFHFAFPWESRNAAGNYSLKVIQRTFEITVPTKSSSITVTGEYEYMGSLPHIERAVGINDNKVEGGIVAFIIASLTNHLSNEEAETVLENEQELNDFLRSVFASHTDDLKNNAFESFGWQYGYVTTAVFVTKVSLPAAVQEARDAVSEAREMMEVVATMNGYTIQELSEARKTGVITPEQYKVMLNQALAVSGNATMDIRMIDLEGAGNGGAKLLAGVLAGTNDSGSNQGKGKGGRNKKQ